MYERTLHISSGTPEGETRWFVKSYSVNFLNNVHQRVSRLPWNGESSKFSWQTESRRTSSAAGIGSSPVLSRLCNVLIGKRVVSYGVCVFLPVVLMSVDVNTSVRLYDESSPLSAELPEESDQFRFLCTVWLVNLKGSVGLILTKSSGMRVTIPLDLYTRSFIPLPHFFRSRRAPPLLTPLLVLFPQRSAQRHTMFFIL